MAVDPAYLGLDDFAHPWAAGLPFGQDEEAFPDTSPGTSPPPPPPPLPAPTHRTVYWQAPARAAYWG